MRRRERWRLASLPTFIPPWLSSVLARGLGPAWLCATVQANRTLALLPRCSSPFSPDSSRRRNAPRSRALWAHGHCAPQLISSSSPLPCQSSGDYGGTIPTWRKSEARSRRVAGRLGVAAAGGDAGEVEEVGEQGVAVLGGDALGVELHAVDGVRLVLQTHDEAVGGAGRDGEVGGQALPLHDQRVVARHLELAGQALEQALAGVTDLGQLAVHRHRRPHHLAAVGLADGLV